jgi:RNA polymerase sigma factor (sigma-70 family)
VTRASGEEDRAGPVGPGGTPGAPVGDALGAKAAVKDLAAGDGQRSEEGLSVQPLELTGADVTAELERQLGLDIAAAVAEAWRVAIRLTGRSEDAEDLCQDVFVNLANSVVAGKLQISAGGGVAYLRQATRNAFSDNIAKRRALKRGGPFNVNPVCVDDMHPEPATAQPTPEESALNTLLQQAIVRAVDNLSSDHRHIMILLINGGKSVNEIADLMDMSPSTVRSRILAARASIRSYLLRNGMDVR